MYKKRKIISFLDNFLEIQDYDDIWYDNGLIIEGRDTISSIAFAVDPTKDVVKKAINREYDMLITHHGMFYKKVPLRIKGNVKRKLNQIIESNLNYYVAHLPLDVNEEIGNAPNVLRGIGAKVLSLWSREGIEVGAVGELSRVVSFSRLLDIFRRNITERVMGMNFGLKNVSVVCAVTLDVDDVIYDSVEFDAIILPTIDHITYQDAKEYGVNVIYADQYDLDRIAFEFLKEKLLEAFPKLHIDFIEDENRIAQRIYTQLDSKKRPALS